jgi:hypothetical protein
MLKGVHLSLLMGPIAVSPVRREVIDALTSVQVTVGSGQRSGFQLTFALSKNSVLTRTLIPAGYFDPMIRVILVVTVNGTPNVLMDGLITRQQMTPSSEPGQSTFVIMGEDVSQAMDLVEVPKFPFLAMPAETRVALIIAKYAMFGIVPLVVPSILIDIPNPIDKIPIQEGSDLAYITQLANDVGYVFYIEPGPLPAMNTAYWGPEKKVGTPQRALTVNWDAPTNVESINFTYDGLSKTLYFMYIQEPFTPAKAILPVPMLDITPLNPSLGAKPPIPFHVKEITAEKDAKGTAKYTPLQAAAIGLAKTSQKSDMISGSGSLDVVRYGGLLKARQLVGVRGAGEAYDGLYFVRSVTTSMKRGEMKQSFTLSRNALIPLSQSVAV